MKNTIKYYFFSFFFAIVACTGQVNESKKVVNRLPSFLRTLSADNFLVNENNFQDLRHPEFCVIDSIIVILDKSYTEGFIRLYDSRNLGLIKSFGIIGRGPGEYYAPSFLHVDKQRKNIWFTDFPKNSFYCFNLEEALVDKDPELTFSVKILHELLPIFNYHIKENGSILLPTTTTNTLFTEIDMNGEVVCTYGTTTEKMPSSFTNQMQYNYFFYKNMVFNEYLNVAIGTFHYHDKLVRFNFTQQEANYFTGKKYRVIKPIASSGNIFNNWNAYTLQIKSTDKYVFSSYLGDNYVCENMKANLPSEIHVFDWNLLPVAKIEFSESIVYFDVIDNNDHFEIFVLTNNFITPFKIYRFYYSTIQ